MLHVLSDKPRSVLDSPVALLVLALAVLVVSLLPFILLGEGAHVLVHDYLDYYANQNADWEAVDYLMKLQGMHAQSFTPEALASFRDRFAAGHGGYPLVGTPDHIVDELVKLSATGVAGTTLAFVDYAEEFPYFRDEVLPRLEIKGLREPV